MHSSDAAVFISSLFITDKGQHHCVIKIQPTIIVSVLVPLKTAAQLAFYTLTRAYKRGLFSNNRRATCWKICNKVSDDTAPGLLLGRSDLLSDETLTAYMSIFVAQDQNPPCQGVKKKKQGRSEWLLPTLAALYQSTPNKYEWKWKKRQDDVDSCDDFTAPLTWSHPSFQMQVSHGEMWNQSLSVQESRTKLHAVLCGTGNKNTYDDGN